MRKLIMTLSMILVAAFFPQQVKADHVTLQEGSTLRVRLLESVSTETHKVNDLFDSALDEDLTQDGYLLAPEGSLVVGRLTTVEESKKVKGRAVLEMTLEEIHVNDATYPIESNKLRIEAEGTKKDDAKVIGGGAGLGALLGAILGGKKGAVIGATIGAGAGTTAVLMTDGDEVTLEPEQQIQFTILEDSEFVSLDSATTSGGDTSFGSDNPFSSDDHQSREEPSKELSENLFELSERVREMADFVEKEQLQETLRENQRSSSDYLELYLSLGEYAQQASLVAELAQDYSPHTLMDANDLLQKKHSQVESLYQKFGRDQHLRHHWREIAGVFGKVKSGFVEARSASVQSGRFHWRGVVDETDQIILRDDQVQIRHIRGEQIYNPVYQLSDPLPDQRLQELELVKLDGRGEVRLIEEPNYRNDFSAVVEIDDDSRGADFYEFELAWQ